ncbi:MAG: hypothetical protein ABIG61_11925 [Planctomycetota bacterium]
MKSTRRHDLKTNELADWVAHVPRLWDEHKRMIIYIAAVGILVLAAWYFKIHRVRLEAQAERQEIARLIGEYDRIKTEIVRAMGEGIDRSAELLRIAANLETAIENLDDDYLASLGSIKRAEALRAELHYRSDNPERQVVVYQIDQAKQSYENALARAGNDPVLTASAKLGLGICEEELGNFDAAKDIYLEIADNPDFVGTTALAQARMRLETLDDYKEKIVFARQIPAAVPELEEAASDSDTIDSSTLMELAEPNGIVLPGVTAENNSTDK